jgi:hypothetical protein
MKIRTRFGIKLSLPFGLFKNAGTFILQLTEAQFEKMEEHVASIQGVLILAGKPEYAGRVFVERG